MLLGVYGYLGVYGCLWMAMGAMGVLSSPHTMQVSLRDRLWGAVLAAMRAAKWENDVTVRAGVRDFEDTTGAIFPACFLVG